MTVIKGDLPRDEQFSALSARVRQFTASTDLKRTANLRPTWFLARRLNMTTFWLWRSSKSSHARRCPGAAIVVDWTSRFHS